MKFKEYVANRDNNLFNEIFGLFKKKDLRKVLLQNIQEFVKKFKSNPNVQVAQQFYDEIQILEDKLKKQYGPGIETNTASKTIEYLEELLKGNMNPNEFIEYIEDWVLAGYKSHIEAHLKELPPELQGAEDKWKGVRGSWD